MRCPIFLRSASPTASKEWIRELSSTGVPGSIEVEFVAEVDDAYTLERIVHNKLSRQRYNKEFFRCELRTVVRVAKESIMESGYGVLSHGGKGSSAFLTQTELLKMQRAVKVFFGQIHRQRQQPAPHLLFLLS